MTNGLDSSQCLGVSYGQMNSGAELDQAPCDSFADQAWIIPGLGSPDGGGSGGGGFGNSGGSVEEE